ncbi:hypothetical protein ACI3LZ_002381 [Candidozyma auris]|nr:hypothetical protein CAJCM15448_40580 [[Candida] auris]
MAQGNLKLRSKAKTRVTKKQQNPRSAAPKIIKPKKASAKQAFKLSKSLSGSAGTEKLIASRVGHLELIKGSRREVEKEEKAKKQKEKNMGMKKDSLSQVNDEVDHASNQQIVQELPALDVDTTAKEAKRESRLRRRTK